MAAYVLASALCAVSPTIGTLIVARLAQGLAGAVGIVIAQAAGRDLYSGVQLLRYYGRLTVLAGLAAIIGPVIGGQLAKITDWRGTFLFLSAVGVIIFVLSAAVMRETLPPHRRHGGGLTETRHVFRRLLADRIFLGSARVTGFVNAALLVCLSGATSSCKASTAFRRRPTPSPSASTHSGSCSSGSSRAAPQSAGRRRPPSSPAW